MADAAKAEELLNAAREVILADIVAETPGGDQRWDRALARLDHAVAAFDPGFSQPKEPTE